MSDHKHRSLLYYKVDPFTLQARVIDALCCILVILGLIGNILGLFVFSSSRRTSRISSIYAYLATSSSITNVFCVIRYPFVLHSALRNTLYKIVGENWWACKIYEISFSFRVISSWLTLFWMFERLMCVSTKLRSSFNRCNSFKLKFIIPIMFFLTLFICIIGPPVYMYQPDLLEKELGDATIDITKTYCKVDSKASVRWKRYFYEIRFGLNHFTVRCFFSELIPTGAVILFNCYIIYCLARKNRLLHQASSYKPYKKKSRTASWMNIILLLHSFLFLASLLSHIVGHFTIIEAHEAWWVLLSILVNSSLNFYIYCLSGKAFRNEICRFIRRFKIQLSQKLHIQLHQRKRYNQNDGLHDEMDNCEVIIPLRTRCLVDLNKRLFT